jgi:hypothetical protein
VNCKKHFVRKGQNNTKKTEKTQNLLHPAANDDNTNFISTPHSDTFLFATNFLIIVTFIFAGNYIILSAKNLTSEDCSHLRHYSMLQGIQFHVVPMTWHNIP